MPRSPDTTPLRSKEPQAEAYPETPNIDCAGRVLAEPITSTVNWLCRLYDRAGECVCDGNADTAAMAMAMTWLSHWCPDALITGRVEIGAVPFNVPEGWRLQVMAADRPHRNH